MKATEWDVRPFDYEGYEHWFEYGYVEVSSWDGCVMVEVQTGSRSSRESARQLAERIADLLNRYGMEG